MKLRLPLIVFALALPVAAAIAVARFSLPDMLPAATKKATELASRLTAKEKPSIVIPESLEEAKKLTVARLMHLQKLTQEQWDTERATIRHKLPPADLHAAIARAQQRVGDLNAMKPEDWPQEKARLEAKNLKLAD